MVGIAASVATLPRVLIIGSIAGRLTGRGRPPIGTEPPVRWLRTGLMQRTAVSDAALAPNVITPAQIELVQSSFLQVLPIADATGVLLYERIFTLAPATRTLFDADIRPQAARLMAAVKAA